MAHPVKHLPASATKPRTIAPPGACDCHFHILSDDPKYPINPASPYLPIDLPLSTYRAAQSTIGIERAVFVQAACYADNRLLIETLKANKNLRGVAVISPQTSNEELEELNSAGCRGIRVFARALDTPTLALMEPLAKRVAKYDWQVELAIEGHLIAALADRIKALPTTTVVNHLAGMTPAFSTDSADFKALKSLVATGRTWIKLSGPYRTSKEGPPFRDLIPLGRALVDIAPERAVWGTDWPNMYPGEPPDAAILLDILAEWAPDEKVRNNILATNPAKLYRF